jgi:STE24 endopeptidase
LLLTPINTILGLINNSLIRRDEHSADIYAAKTYSDAAIKSALKKISADSLSNLSPHPLYVAFNYSHPPLTARMNHVDKFAKELR